MMVRNVSLSYSNNAGMLIPGYKDRTMLFGMNPRTPFGGTAFTPGLGFVFGDQRDPRDQLVADTLLSKAYINTPFTRTETENINGRANIEPIRDFKIEITANRNKTKNFSEIFRYDDLQDAFLHLNPNESGNFSMSFLSYKTAFEKNQANNNNSQTFENFLNYRATISDRLHQQNSNNSTTLLTTGFWNGYGSTSQEVLMFSFISAYSGANENTVSLKTFPTIPKPNWRITYDGLGKLAPLKKRFKTVTLSHAYRSSLTYGYTTNLNFVESNGGPSATNAVGNFIIKDQISSLSIAEQFSPLMKLDVTMNNNITGNFEIKKDRNVALSFANNQVTEVNGREFVLGAGYRIPNFEFKLGKGKRKFKSDLVLRGDFSVRNNRTVIRKVVEQISQPTAGQKIISIKLTADYVLSQKLNIRLFYDHTLTRPAISTSFNSSNINSGVAIRFSLSQ
jgi:cell surface protein SprA